MNSQILILGFHRVGYPPVNATHRCLFTTPRLLDFQIRFVKMLGFEFVTLKEAFDRPEGKLAVVTFDDGYKDNLTAGLPVLQKHQIPATVFVITGDVDAKNKSWEEAGEKLPADFMSWDDLRILRSNGWEIASHSYEHIHLADRTHEEQLNAIDRSIVDIEMHIGEAPVSFAYPYGSYDQNTKDALRQSGMRFAVTIDPADKSRPVSMQDRLELSRVSIGGRLPHHYFKSVARTMKAIGTLSLIPRPVVFAPSVNRLNADGKPQRSVAIKTSAG